MEAKYQLSCESAVDMPYSYIAGRDISVIFYTYVIDGVEYEDNMERDPDALPEFYEKLAKGALPSTAQINRLRYQDYFESLLKQGKDVLHITLGTGMTPSYNNAVEAANDLKEKYPDRKLMVLDSVCSSSGYGLMMDYVADMRDAGASMEDIEAWVTANCTKVHHQFFSTDLTMFKRSGRVSGPSATVGTVLGICPLMRLNRAGAIIAYSKVRGKNKAISETAKAVMEHIQDGEHYTGKLFINNSNCREMAEATRAELIPYLGDLAANAPIYNIGMVIASHCGPGTVAVFFMGDERKEE